MESKNYANPAPLGLTGFAMTTIMLNIHNTGIIELNSVIVALGMFYGGAAQLVAGWVEFKQGKFFGATAFTSYGFFWLTLCAIWILPILDLATEPSMVSMGFFLMLWGFFTLYLFIGSLKSERATQVVFGTLTLLFFLLSIADFTESETLKVIAGWEGIICGISAFYNAAAQVINSMYERKVLPI